ncbi:MAG TPA: glycosyltransferase family 2 protein [Propionibacterium sp.]|nr:glycosyltransferase family 2 protein [Propionibacterium sp.]
MATPDPRVSVIMRTRDRSHLLRRAVADVAAQTFTDWELLLVVEGDAAPVEQFVGTLEDDLRDRVQVLHRPDVHDRESTADAGAEVARGEFVAYHDVDDTWEPPFLQRTVAHLDERPDHAGVITRYDLIHEEAHGPHVVETHQEAPWCDLPPVPLPDLLRTNAFTPIQLLYRRWAHGPARPLREDVPPVENWAFHLRPSPPHTVSLVDEVLAHRHVHPHEPDAPVAPDGPGGSELTYLTRYLQREFHHLHARLGSLEERVGRLEEQADRVEHRVDKVGNDLLEHGFTALARRKYWNVRNRLQRG